MTATLVMSLHHSGKTPVFIQDNEAQHKDWNKIYDPEVLNHIIPIFIAWELNERMYGELQGLNKAAMVQKFGAEQVQIWRRSFDVGPPRGESLAMTANRTIPYFNKRILPELQNQKNVFVPAHGNSLRSIIMEIDKLSPDEVVHLELRLTRRTCHIHLRR